MSMMDDCYRQGIEQDDLDIPECETCGKSLDDETHKCHWECEDDPDGPELVCDEIVRICEICGENDVESKHVHVCLSAPGGSVPICRECWQEGEDESCEDEY